MMKLRSTLPFVLLAGVLAGCQPSTNAGAPAANNTPPAADAAAPAAEEQSSDVVVSLGLYANGFSPAWEAHLMGEALRFSVPEIGTPNGDLRTITVTCAEEENAMQCTGKDGEVTVEMSVRQENCVKSLNGEEEESRELSAALRYGDSRYEGCADVVMTGEVNSAPEAAPEASAK